MKSTPVVRKEARDKIELALKSSLLDTEERESLQNVLNIINDVDEYATFWRELDFHIGLNQVRDLSDISLDVYKVGSAIRSLNRFADYVDRKNI